MKNINIWKRMCQVGRNVVFLEVILKLHDVCFMKNIFIPASTVSSFRKVYVSLMLFVFICVYKCPTHIVLCLCFVFLRTLCS